RSGGLERGQRWHCDRLGAGRFADIRRLGPGELRLQDQYQDHQGVDDRTVGERPPGDWFRGLEDVNLEPLVGLHRVSLAGSSPTRRACRRVWREAERGFASRTTFALGEI